MAEGNDTFSYGTVPPVSTHDLTLGVVALFTFIIGTPGSVMSFVYFAFRCDKTSSTIQYMIINLIDAITTLLLLCNGLSEILGTPGVFANHTLCSLWGYLWNVTIRMSVFLVAVLSLSRCISLYNPLRRYKTKSVLLPILVYFIILLVQQILPFVKGRGFWYAKRMSMCIWLIGDIYPDFHSFSFKMLHFIFMFVEFVIPVCPVIISCGVSIKVLQRRKIHGPINTVKNHKSHATVTIIYLTLAYVTFNLPLILYICLETVYLWRNMSGNINNVIGISTSLYSFLAAFVNNQMVTLNATANVIIYFCRNKDLRGFWTSAFLCKVDQLARRKGSVYVPPPHRSTFRHSVKRNGDYQTADFSVTYYPHINGHHMLKNSSFCLENDIDESV